MSRLRARANQDKDAQQIKAMAAVIKELQTRCETLEGDFARANQRVAVFQHETFTLRSLVKLADHPELADAARAEAERLVAKEEVRVLKERMRELQRESEGYRSRCVEACDAADALGEQLRLMEGEVSRLRTYVKQLLQAENAVDASETDCLPTPPAVPTAADSGESNDGMDERVVRVSDEDSDKAERERAVPKVDIDKETSALRIELEAERARRAALEEAVEALQAERTKDRSNAAPAELIIPPSDDRGASSRRPPALTPSEKAARTELKRAMRLQKLTKAENALLTKRVTSLVAQNRNLLSRLAATEAEAALLRHHVSISSSSSTNGGSAKPADSVPAQ